MALSKKAGSSQSEASWVKVSTKQPDLTSPFPGAGCQLLFLFVAIAALTFTAVQWRSARSFANLWVTFFCERVRQCGMAKALAKRSASFHLCWARVSLNAGLAHIFFVVALKGAWRRQKEVEEASALPRKVATNADVAKTCLLLQVTKVWAQS